VSGYLHLQNTPLPTNRFEAYEHVVKHFIQEHPLARKTAAASTNDASALTHEENRVPTSVIMPLSLGWRQSELLKRLDFDHNPRDVGASELYAKYALALAAEIPPIIEADLGWSRHNKYQVTMMTKPLLARLRFDPEVATQSFAYLKTSTNPSVKASFPKLLAAIGEMTAERAGWCRAELERQQSLRSPEIGFDVLARVSRSVSLCLLESLGETQSAGTRVSPES
jgi:hypothetical protein